MADENICPHCGKPVPAAALGGVCPECMLKAGLASQTEAGRTDQPGSRTLPPPPRPEDIASLFPQLEIIECLGRGGMGAVYKARQPKLARFVALKILARDKENDPRFAERFEREAQALARLNHPNIVAVYDFGEVAGHCFLLIEFVDGMSLRQLIQRERLLPEEALKIVPPICEALQFAHEHGIVHRDIKPENILLDKQGRVKIADFGIAKMVDANVGQHVLTGVKNIVGTPHYMAPEQIEKPQRVDHRADIYSLGVVFYEMLTGELPLGKFQPPSAKVQMDVRLDEVVLRSLEKEPERRYQHVSEVRTKVETIASTPETGGRQGGRSPVENPSKQSWRMPAIAAMRRGGIVGVAVFFLIVAAAVFGTLLYRESSAGRNSTGRSDYIGQSWFPRGDSIEITSVERDENQMKVKGRYNLVSAEQATLTLFITTKDNVGVPINSNQTMRISKGPGDFELVQLHVVPGLPHVSMYAASGHSFAALYFGTQQEAAEESKAAWITNGPFASAETWSPDLSSGEKPDFQKILDSAKSLMNEGSYQEALQRYLWYFNHSRNDAGQKGVRVSFALSDWTELGRRYPKAKQALIEIRDADAREFLEGRGYFELFMELNSLNQALQDDNATYTLFKTLERQDKELARQCYPFTEGLLVQHGEYGACLDYIGDPEAKFKTLCDNRERSAQMEQRQEALQQQSAERMREWQKNLPTNGIPRPPLFPQPPFPKFADRNFVGQTCQLIEILVGAGHKADAEKIRDEAVAVLDDAKLKSAVSDAGQRVAQRAAAAGAK